jgi:hypothetical protein
LDGFGIYYPKAKMIKKFAIIAINKLLNDERNHSKYALECILQFMNKVDLENEWRKYYSEIIKLK